MQGWWLGTSPQPAPAAHINAMGDVQYYKGLQAGLVQEKTPHEITPLHQA